METLSGQLHAVEERRNGIIKFLRVRQIAVGMLESILHLREIVRAPARRRATSRRVALYPLASCLCSRRPGRKPLRFAWFNSSCALSRSPSLI